MRGGEIWSIAECLNIVVDTEPQVGSDGGIIDLNISGGLPPYTISWNTGDDTEVLENLASGTYMATITDASGCLSEITAEVAFVSKTEALLSDNLVNLFPNPSTGSFVIEAPDTKVERIEILDLEGRLIYQKPITQQTDAIPVRLRYAPSGVYVLKITTPEGIIAKKTSVE